MKKICLIALSYLILSFATKDQDSPYAFIKYFNECVNIYQAPTGREVTGCIFQDSFTGDTAHQDYSWSGVSRI